MPEVDVSEDTSLRVLTYEEDGEWVALALEMDLRGYGPTREEALARLKELVEMQVSFAVFKGHPEMIWKDAEPAWFSRYEQEEGRSDAGRTT